MSNTIAHEPQPAGAADRNPPPAGAATPDDRQPARNQRLHGAVALAAQSIPPLIVLAALAALGYWGHRTGWKLPHVADGASGAERDDWCAEHNVPESQCVECAPDKFPKPTDHGWCETHGVHQCPFENPDVMQVKEPWRVNRQTLDHAAGALALRPRPENNPACTSYRRRIQFASHDCALMAGVDVEPAVLGPITESVSATAEVRYDATRVAQLSTKSPGTAWRVDKQLGDAVRPGDVLALVDAAEVGRLRSELLAALADVTLRESTLRRAEALAAQGITAERQKQEAEAEWTKAKTRLLAAEQALHNLGLPVSRDSLRGLSEDQLAARIRLLGLPDAVARQLEANTSTSNLIAVTAPLGGVVVARDVVAGEVVDTSRVLFKVADTTRMWLVLNVPIEDAALVRSGQPVRFLPDGTVHEVAGAVAWVSTAVDARTRTVQVRADLENDTGQLRAETFGVGRIVLRQEPQAVVVPSEAVQWDGSCHVVFVRDRSYFDEAAPKLFHTRSVRVGVKADAVTEILAGIVPGEVVATTGSGVLRAQLLKNSIGAG